MVGICKEKIVRKILETIEKELRTENLVKKSSERVGKQLRTEN